MAQTIKIKRSTGSSAPSTLANGELAYLNNSANKKLYIGRPGGGTGDIDVIGGKDFTDKLDGIESGATADQTNTEIRDAVGAATNSNIFTDADHTKLNAIEALADVTDTANVTSAGALMDSEVTNLADVKAFDSSDYATAAQGTLATNALPKSGGTMTGNIVLGDNNSVQFGGTSTNLEIYNDGTTSYITENASGNLEIKATDFNIKDGGGQTMMSFDADGSLRIYDQSATNPVQRFGTTSTGVTINGKTNTTSLKMGNETVTVSSIKDEDNMSSNSATSLATQQSIKAYVDNATTMGNFTFTDDEIISSGSTMTLDPHADGITGKVVVNGDLEVKGVTTTIDSTTVTIADNYIQLNSAQDETQPPPSSMFCGIQVDRGNQTYDSGIYWVESTDEWVVNTGGAGINRLIHDSNFEAKYPTLDGGTF